MDEKILYLIKYIIKCNNIPWSNKVILERLYHRIRLKESGKGEIIREGGKIAIRSGQSQRQTALELGISNSQLSKDMFLASELNNPKVRDARNKIIARKIAINNIVRYK